MYKHLISGLSILLLLTACSGERNEQSSEGGLNLDWMPVDSVNNTLPDGIRVYHTRNAEENLRAWYVMVEESLPDIETRVKVSTDSDRRETVTDFARRLGVPVMINGGYFRMDRDPATHVGILKSDDTLYHAATTSVLRSEERFYTYRAAIALDANDYAKIGWVSSTGDSVFFWDRPIENYPEDPGERLNPEFAQLLQARDILGGGPQLIREGKIAVSVNEEVFFGTSIPEVHPRTAVGITAERNLILLLVDGRQLVSRGVDLQELAGILHDLGCVEAINLDGGGSSALVVNGELLNRPSGKTQEREVMSALAVYAD